MSVRILLSAVLSLGCAQVSASAAPGQPQVVVDQKSLKAAEQALAKSEYDRLISDKRYAEEMLRHIDIVRNSAKYSGEGKISIDSMKVVALMGAGRDRESFDLAVELTNLWPGRVGLHTMAFFLGSFVDSERALAELEKADRALESEEDRDNFREGLEVDRIHAFRQSFYAKKDKSKVARSAKALLNFGWPGPERLDLTDSLRLEVADDLLARGDVEGARKLAFSIQRTKPVLTMLISRRWSPVLDSGDPGDRLAQAVAASDDASRRALGANPNDLKLLLDRAQFLRSVGKENEAVQLLLPKANNISWVKKNGADGHWIVNEAAYALVAVKREKEAVALMRKLLALGLAENPGLISMAINTTGMMVDAGDYAGAAAHSATLANNHGNIASPYGRMWMWEGAVCGNMFAGRPDEAKPWLAKLRAGEKDNPAALTRASLCMNDADGTAAIVIRRLEGSDPDDMLIAIQDYSIGPSWSPPSSVLNQRFRQVIGRPDVQAAVAKHGRIMRVPLSRTYWGMF